jgi:ABC-type Fe3+/spermidine/putrescine transport system ATPase subunit
MSDALRIDAIGKRFGMHVALEDVSLSVEPGEFVTILGPSGSGKSTTLRVVAGLERPDSGTVQIGGADVTNLPPHRRDCAMVFQNYALFPHRSIAENIAFGLRMRGGSGSAAERAVGHLLDLVGLDGQGAKRPHQLSGGQQQRVAVARALAVEPAVLLLDEPLGALDHSLRRQMQSEIRSIQRATGRAFIHVTHDQGEALALSDRIVVLNEGRVTQIGSPEEVYERPASRFVAEFMGFRNFLPIEITDSGQVRIAGFEMTIPGNSIELDGPLVAAIRPERVGIGDPVTGSRSTWGVVTSQTYAGSSWTHEIDLSDGTRIVANAHRAFRVGGEVDLSIDPANLVLLSE